MADNENEELIDYDEEEVSNLQLKLNLVEQQ